MAPPLSAPLSGFPPPPADISQLICYIFLANLSAFTWDWLVSIAEEYRIVHKTRLKPPIVAYFLSRVATMGYCITSVIFAVAPVKRCQMLIYISFAFLLFAFLSKSSLFLFRVAAVYNHSKIFVIFFSLLLITISGLWILNMMAIKVASNAMTGRCQVVVLPDYCAVPTLLTAVFDTLVFLAISYRMVFNNAFGNTWRVRASSFFTGHGLYSMSKALLQSGQIYYLATVWISIATTWMYFSPSIPTELRAPLGSSYAILSSAMGCLVFRAVMLRSTTGLSFGEVDTSSVMVFAPPSEITSGSQTLNFAGISRLSGTLKTRWGSECLIEMQITSVGIADDA